MIKSCFSSQKKNQPCPHPAFFLLLTTLLWTCYWLCPERDVGLLHGIYFIITTGIAIMIRSLKRELYNSLTLAGPLNAQAPSLKSLDVILSSFTSFVLLSHRAPVIHPCDLVPVTGTAGKDYELMALTGQRSRSSGVQVSNPLVPQSDSDNRVHHMGV